MKKAFFSKVAGSLLLSAGVLASGAAFADETITFDTQGNAVFGLTHETAGDFVDTYLFSIDPATQAWLSGTAITGKTWIDGARLANYGITDITFFSEVNGVRTNLDTAFTSGNAIEFYPVESLLAGNYGFTVTGSTLNNASGGSYAGTLNVVAAPIPEPATYAMLGIGIGLLAFSARGKTNNKLG